MGKLLEAAAAASAEHRRRVSTATLNLVLREASNWRQPPTARGSPRKGRIYYATQARPSRACYSLQAQEGRLEALPYVGFEC